ncbi:sulfatase family protein [Algibacter mikhailovii]|uniref:sulfatase family protein n=1 Tax=Algibacter mikhailovii TaxID=425498 RepID=UPI002493D46B|nr:arylsulfatase [Algibacter mikhailovii]
MNTKSTKYIIQLIIPFFAIIFGVSAQNQSVNVVYIMADDIGLGDIGFYHRERTGNKEIIPTPNIDKLIENGMRFSNAHSPAALCAPTRYSVMSGNYPIRSYAPWGVWGGFGKNGIEKGQKNIATVMNDAGYKTAFFGKWGFGSRFYQKGTTEFCHDNYGNIDVDISRIIDGGPLDLGFNYSCSLPAGIQNSPYAFYENDVWMKLKPNSELIVKNGKGRKPFLGDSNWKTEDAGFILVSKTAEFIKSAVNENPKKPFFIYYCSQAVHSPHRPPLTFNGSKVKASTPSNHGDMIRELDMQVGFIIDALKKNDVFKNTLIVFTSDNGGLNIAETEKAGHDSSNGLRSYKSSIYEGGHRVPYIVRWPGITPSGVTCTEPVLGTDLMATLVELTGGELDDNRINDSFNILPFFKEEKTSENRIYYTVQSAGKNPYVAIWENDLKLILKTEKTNDKVLVPTALFNITKNPYEYEKDNLIHDAEYKFKISQLIVKYNEIKNIEE